MGRSNAEVAHEIFFAGRHTLGTTAAATLRAIERDRITLDISEMGQGDDHVLFDNQVFVRDAIDRLSELCSALIPVLRFDFAKLVEHDLKDALVRRKQCLQVVDFQAKLGEFVEDALPLHRGQSAQAHIEDSLGLSLRERVALHQLFAGTRGVRGGTDKRDDLVEMIERDREAFEDMCAGLGLSQVINRAPNDDFFSEL